MMNVDILEPEFRETGVEGVDSLSQLRQLTIRPL